MHTTLSSKWHLPTLFVAVMLLAGCGVTTKKTFLGEPVQKTPGNAVPVSSGPSGQTLPDELSRNPALDSAEATGVQKLLNIITPYRINIQQGNFVSQEMLARIQPGMTKEQVRFALGTPLLTDLFHSARWDYLFRLQKPNGQVTNNRVILYFEDNRVARIVNDPLPEETQYLETIAGPAPKKKADGSGRKAPAASEKEPDAQDSRQALKETAPPADSAAPAQTPESAPSSPEAATAIPAVTDIHDASPSPTETPAIAPAPRETFRPAPVETGTQEAARPATVTPAASPVNAHRAEPAVTPEPEVRPTPETIPPPAATPAARETYRAAPVETTGQEIEPVSTVSTPPAPAVEAPRTHTPAPAAREKPAATTQAATDEPEDDFRAAPNSTMQLHELMQPQ